MKNGIFKILLAVELCVCLVLSLASCDVLESLGIFTDKAPEGEYILFGEYPQTIKSDEVSVTDTTDARGYFLGSDGAYYAAVTATPYHSDYKFSSGAEVTEGAVYYFKVEPIRWRILTEADGKALLLCDSIIANKAYDAGEGYNNNYADSDIRQWLTGEFYSAAFDELAQERILETTIDNSARSTNPDAEPTQRNDGANSYACEDTTDKVFLLSLSEVTSSDYGFATYSKNDAARRMQISDYAISTGAYIPNTSGRKAGNGYWWLRSPDYYLADSALSVDFGGYAGNSGYTNNGSDGVVPALWMIRQ